MKNGRRISVFALVTLMATSANAQPAALGPQMVFNDHNVTRARGLVTMDPHAEARWKEQKGTADAALAKLPSGEKNVDAALKALALAWRMTGQKSYAQAARDLLLVRASRQDWLTDKPLAKRNPPWRSDLGMGSTAASYGIAYDAIRDTLTAQERQIIVAGLVRGAILPVLGDWVDDRSRIHALDTMGHNWWGHIVFGTGVGVLAILRDEPRAAEWASRIDQASVEWFSYGGSTFETKPPTFGIDGAYSETIGYAELGLHSLMLFRRSWQEVHGRPPSPISGLARTADYFLATSYPGSTGWKSLNFGDSRPYKCGCETIADFWAMGNHDPAYLSYIEGFASHAESDPWRDPINLPYFPDAESRKRAGLGALPTASVFSSQGLVTMRTDWGEDATMFSMKAGFTWNHNHADASSFILYHRGKTMLADSGHSSYSTPEYDGFYRQSQAHNVVTINGNAEPPSDLYDGSHFSGRIEHFVDAPGLRYVWADATGPTSRYFQRNFRNVMWIDDTLLVLDDLKSWEAGTFEWLLHHAGSAKRSGQTVEIRDGDVGVDIRPLFPQPLPDGGLPTDYPEALRLVEKAGLKDADPRTTQTYLGFQAPEQSDRTKFVVAIQPLSDGSKPSKIERLEGRDWIGARITTAARTTEVYLNLLADGRVRHRNANTSLAGYETDAYILALSWPVGADRSKAPASYFVANGSYLRKEGEVLLGSLSKVFAHVGGDTKRVAISRQPTANVRFACSSPLMVGEATLPCVSGFATLPSNGQK